jgi:Mn2+/Fe2+ NRAMP family transporter
MADATELITGMPSEWCTPTYAVLILGLMIWSSYRTIARIFKWFTVALLAYILAAFLAKPHWRAVFESTFIPRIQWSNAYLATLVAIFGTTISPYLFFWEIARNVVES